MQAYRYIRCKSCFLSQSLAVVRVSHQVPLRLLQWPGPTEAAHRAVGAEPRTMGVS